MSGTALLGKKAKILFILFKVRVAELMWEGMGKSTSIRSSNKEFQSFSKGLGRMRFLKVPEIEDESKRDIFWDPLGFKLKSPIAMRVWALGSFTHIVLTSLILFIILEVVSELNPKLCTNKNRDMFSTLRIHEGQLNSTTILNRLETRLRRGGGAKKLLVNKKTYPTTTKIRVSINTPDMTAEEKVSPGTARKV